MSQKSRHRAVGKSDWGQNTALADLGVQGIEPCYRAKQEICHNIQRPIFLIPSVPLTVTPETAIGTSTDI